MSEHCLLMMLIGMALPIIALWIIAKSLLNAADTDDKDAE